MITEDWDLLISFFPEDWRRLAVSTKALKGLRKDKSESSLLRTLLIHLASGCSLRETVVRARQANLADLSDVALLKRLKKCKDWLHSLCVSLFKERGLKFDEDDLFKVRLFDATNVKEPGKTGSLWRIHYSIQAPSMCCDFFKITEVKGKGSGESFKQFPILKNEYVIADRGYSTGSGVSYVTSKKAYVMVRLNTQSMPLYHRDNKPFPLVKHLSLIKKAGAPRSWDVSVLGPNTKYINGRVCAIRKSEEAIRIALKKQKQAATKKGVKTLPETKIFAEYIIVFTTFPANEFSTHKVLDWYRIRWQIELVFKRFKQIAQLGHVPKHDDESAKAWLYGKLFIALITEKLIEQANSISPWGYILGQLPTTESMA